MPRRSLSDPLFSAAPVSAREVPIGWDGLSPHKHHTASSFVPSSYITSAVARASFSPLYISSNAGKFLDHEWIDIPMLKEYLARTLVPNTSISSLRFVSKSKPLRLSLPRSKWSPRLSDYRQLLATSGWRIVRGNFAIGPGVLLSDSEPQPSDHDSDLEVLTLQPTSRSSRSSIAIPDPCDVHADEQFDPTPSDELSALSNAVSISNDKQVDGDFKECFDPSKPAESHTLWQEKIQRSLG
ncbi:hypothetical protein DFH07DRAFT_782771 [Mycena maculata]|uniref:Uncharacterized protein n=1 Tax=Mycena maculata TaxID=230809 RepID=A0AAD7HR83_9AGAR|nr:hypothetical protein DFH07DRAFT_782771 [Mycena maculata]